MGWGGREGPSDCLTQYDYIHAVVFFRPLTFMADLPPTSVPNVRTEISQIVILVLLFIIADVQVLGRGLK